MITCLNQKNFIIYKVLKSFGEIEWGGYSPSLDSKFANENAQKSPHHTVWRWKNPDPQLDKLIVEAVNSFKGEIEWIIRFRDRKPSLGGRNWIIEPKRKQEFYDEHQSLDYHALTKLIMEKEPEIGILSNKDVPQLAKHIQQYVEKNWQFDNYQLETSKILKIKTMKQTIKKIKISDIPEAIQRMGIDRETMINLTIETVDDDLLAAFVQIGQAAKEKGLTEEILEELLADES